MKRWKRDEGISLVWLGMTLVLLIGMAGFGTDLGWLFLNTSRAQKAVDAAALAGVVNLPGFISQAGIDASNAARANGYDPGGADTLTVTPLADNRLHAELQTEVKPFFLGVLGFDHFNVTREATAEYVKPVPLGDPNNCFGCRSLGDSWAAVSSPYISKEYGDPYSTQCLVSSGDDSCSSGNVEFNRGGAYEGYYYGIEVPPGSADLTVRIYDATFSARSVDVETGDFAFGSAGPTTNYSVHLVDTTPLDPTNNPAAAGCSRSVAPEDNTYLNNWQEICFIGGTLTEGIYVLHVWTSGEGQASNHYSIEATLGTAPPQPRVFGINDMSIWSNALTSTSQLYLAEIDEIHAGKKLELQFFDPGDAGAPSEMSVQDPFGNVPSDCTWQVWDHDLTTELGSPGSVCSWTTSNQIYNNQWIVAVIDLPDNPDDMCDESKPADLQCFWSMDLNLFDPTERTTWRVRVIGNPVRLIPNGP